MTEYKIRVNAVEERAQLEEVTRALPYLSIIESQSKATKEEIEYIMVAHSL